MEIAHQHNASVNMESTHPGQVPPGARFTVRFKVDTTTLDPA
jgi:two-component system sensor histidine kinase TctE